MRKISFFLLLVLTACGLLQASPAPVNSSLPRPAETYEVISHPAGPLYVGDQVSFEVIPPTALENGPTAVRLGLGETDLGAADFSPYGMAGRRQATLYWVWKTAGLEPGSYTLTFTLLPAGSQWDETLTLLPAAEVPFPEPNAHWNSLETTCCLIHYISGTQAETDLELLVASANVQAAKVEASFGAKFKDKIPLTILPRVIGHGGFASDGIYLTYLRQNYAGADIPRVIHHEMVHWLDNQQKNGLRPSILQEGLAVYLSQGHFKAEASLPRAAALLELGWYQPLRELTNNFYFIQHETGYAEAAGLVGYLMTTYGKDKFNAFYRGIKPAHDGTEATALENALETHFQLSLDELDENFKAFLRQQPFSADDLTDLRLTVAYYDTLRRYQQTLDPAAHFLTAWLPNPREMRERGIVADFLRAPRLTPNRQIEARLVAADASLRAGRYAEAEAELQRLNLVLSLSRYWVK